jgi:hypothetical protein
VSISDKLNEIPPSEELMKQLHTARELLLKPTEIVITFITEHEENGDKNDLNIPVSLEAHIIALIQGGLS